MSRVMVRTAWVAIGICLVIGLGTSLVLLLGPPDQPWSVAVRELSTLIDVAALLFWIAIFAIYWARKQKQSG